MVIKILAYIGGLTLFILSAIILLVLIKEIEDYICRCKYRYEYKHRFNKPPTAECYCRDCKQHSDETNICYVKGWYVVDSWFCSDAEPKDRKPAMDFIFEKKEEVE